MNWNEATLEQCRDFLAECRGWTFDVRETESDTIVAVWKHATLDPLCSILHPVPPTLDSIAASLPEGWSVLEIIMGQYGKTKVTVCKHPDDLESVAAFADSESLARARCACLAWEASGK